MTKILCIGNNTVDTDLRTANLAMDNGAPSHGLLSELDGSLPDEFDQGYYHTSVYDIEYHRLLELARQFDLVTVLDQPKETYSHPDAFYRTVRLACELEKTHPVVWLDPAYSTAINFFEKLVETNKSFCIFPFIELLTNNGSTTVCCRSYTQITKLSELQDFQTDPHYSQIRQKMLAGELLPEHCSSCYRLENQGIVSARQQETVEWANRLNLSSLEDLAQIKTPAYYEVRASNVCNLQCRTCTPTQSHLLAREFRSLQIIDLDLSELEYTNFDFIDFANLKKLYVSGGEPTAMTEFYDFLDRCIENQRTNFELLINTNATKLSDKFKEQLRHFSSVTFIVSVDGYKDVNHYVRWPSDWDRIVENARYLYEHFTVSFNITVSIYNILTLNQLLEFLDSEFPRAIVHCQFADSIQERLSALNWPYPEQLLEPLARIQKLRCYKNDKLLASFIDGVINHYAQQPQPDLSSLRAFFDFNDRLDRSRNLRLGDYVPELEQARHLV